MLVGSKDEAEVKLNRQSYDQIGHSHNHQAHRDEGPSWEEGQIQRTPQD